MTLGVGKDEQLEAALKRSVAGAVERARRVSADVFALAEMLNNQPNMRLLHMETPKLHLGIRHQAAPACVTAYVERVIDQKQPWISKEVRREFLALASLISNAHDVMDLAIDFRFQELDLLNSALSTASSWSMPKMKLTIALEKPDKT